MDAPMTATRKPMISAPEFAPGATSLYCSVMAKNPKTRKAVRTISSPKACRVVMPTAGWVKKTPAAPPSRAGEVIGEVEAIDNGGEEQADNARADECADGLRGTVREDLFPGEFSDRGPGPGSRRDWPWPSADGRCVNGDGDRQTPRDADAPVGVLIRAGVVERIHGATDRRRK